MITDRDKEICLAQSNSTLCRWWCLLNSWEWPAELPDPEPREYVLGGRRGQIMSFIWGIVGDFAVSQEWNCRYLTQHRMTAREHHDFWFACHEDDPGAKVRYEESQARRLKEMFQ